MEEEVLEPVIEIDADAAYGFSRKSGWLTRGPIEYLALAISIHPWNTSPSATSNLTTKKPFNLRVSYP